MSKNKKNVNEEVVEAIENEELLDIEETEVVEEEPKKRKINFKAVVKIAVGAIIVVAGAAIAVAVASGGLDDDTLKAIEVANAENEAIDADADESNDESDKTEK